MKTIPPALIALLSAIIFALVVLALGWYLVGIMPQAGLSSGLNNQAAVLTDPDSSTPAISTVHSLGSLPQLLSGSTGSAAALDKLATQPPKQRADAQLKAGEVGKSNIAVIE